MKTSNVPRKDHGEHRGILPGWTWAPRINLVSVFVYLVLTGIVVLVIWRITGYPPLQQVPGSGAAASGRKFSRTYVLLGVYQGRVYYFDQQAQGVVEYDPARPREHEQVGPIPSVEVSLLSPQMDKIALVSARVKEQTGIYVLQLSSPGNLLLVTPQQAGFTPGYILKPESDVSWSPGGEHIAFVAYKGDQSDLFVARSDSTKVQRLTYHGANVGTVVWVDQKTIAFVSDWEGQDLMYLIELDGGNLRRAR